jgi:hypothetical protein
VKVYKLEKASEFRNRTVGDPRRFCGDAIVETRCGVVNDVRISPICTFTQSKFMGAGSVSISKSALCGSNGCLRPLREPTCIVGVR